MPKNIILFMTDQHRIDHAGWAPDCRVSLPNLDRIAGSVGFTNCSTANPICTPARVALLTGKYTHQVGMVQMAGDVSPQHPTYLRALQRAGYHTAAVGKLHWLQGWPWGTDPGKGHPLAEMHDELAQFGLDHVWEASGKQLAMSNNCDYCAHLERKGLLDAYRAHAAGRGRNTMHALEQTFPGDAWPFDEADYIDVVAGDEMLRALDARPADRPFFLFASFCCPHPPYDPPARYLDMFPEEEGDDFIDPEGILTPEVRQRLRRPRRAYKAMLKLVDDQIGRVLDKLEADGLMDDTVLLFTADHGEMMGDHGFVQKSQPYRSSVTVPTAIRHPDHLDGRVNGSPVELTDLTATILDVAGLDPQEALSAHWPAFNDIVPGRSLMPIVRGECDAVREFAFSECSNHWQSITTDRWKYIYRLRRESPDDVPAEELYDTVEDPRECVNRIDDPAAGETADWCRRRLRFVMDTTPPAQLRWAPIVGMPPEEYLL